MRLKLIACEVLYRELCYAVARSVNQVDLEFLPKGLHDRGSAAMAARVQQAVDQTPAERYDAIALGYALCGNGLAGVAARSRPLVVARAHDCITLLLGSKERYAEYFAGHPGVYFKTSGWIERGQAGDTQVNLEYDNLAARYGEENARYLFSELTRHYRQLTYIEMGIEPDDRFERETRALALSRGWRFEKAAGDLGLLRRLVDGPWEERQFLVVPPGCSVRATGGEEIIEARPA
jgi:hypothetical protein